MQLGEAYRDVARYDEAARTIRLALDVDPRPAQYWNSLGTVLGAAGRMSEAERARAFDAGLAAYRNGDFFEAHELLEPAWMGTDDPVERDLYQGLIKLAAAYVHGVRGNPAGIAKNLVGARARLAAVVEAGELPASLPPAARDLDVGSLVTAVDARLAELAALDRAPSHGLSGPPVL